MSLYPTEHEKALNVLREKIANLEAGWHDAEVKLVDAEAKLAAALTLTSEQATEILALQQDRDTWQSAAEMRESNESDLLRRIAEIEASQAQEILMATHVLRAEILGKEKEIARLEAKLQSERGEDALATIRLLDESDAQSALLKKAEAALAEIEEDHVERLARWMADVADAWTTWPASVCNEYRERARAALQLKGK